MQMNLKAVQPKLNVGDVIVTHNTYVDILDCWMVVYMGSSTYGIVNLETGYMDSHTFDTIEELAKYAVSENDIILKNSKLVRANQCQ